MMKLHLTRIVLLGLAWFGLSNSTGKAQVLPVFQDETNQPGYVTNDYKFTGITQENYPTYPTLSAHLGAWPAPIVANGGNSAETFNKVIAGDTSDFLGSSSGGGIYTLFSQTTFSIHQANPLPDLSHLTFQVYMAAGVDPAATNNLYINLPTLTLNLADSTQVVITGSSGTILSALPAVVFGQNTSVDDIAFNFNVSGVTEPISSYTVNWKVAQHSITYGMDLTEVQAVPEPSSWAMVLLAGGALFLFRARQRQSRLD